MYSREVIPLCSSIEHEPNCPLRVMQTLDRAHAALLKATTVAELFDWICQAAVIDGLFSLAWIGEPQYNDDKTVRIVAQAGPEQQYLHGIQITWDEGIRGSGPAGMAIRTNATQINDAMYDNPAYSPWVERAKKCGFKSSVALPIRDPHGGLIAALMLYSKNSGSFSGMEVRLLEQLTKDISYSIENIRIRQAYDRAMIDTVEALASTLEMRDPYTAGHEHRVAALAVAIGEKLGLTKHQIKGIQFGAILHDIGKIAVPAEILVKPSRLTPIEFDLVKQHPETGYKILNRIAFPWPIADIVRQHHERIDGTGYPLGLKGDEIRIESKVVAVADIVESITAHRPYRPALGVDAAIKEMDRLDGTGLDSEVIAACKKVLAGGFVID